MKYKLQGGPFDGKEVDMVPRTKLVAMPQIDLERVRIDEQGLPHPVFDVLLYEVGDGVMLFVRKDTVTYSEDRIVAAEELLL
jgi:hypothetical protein